ncbi:MAG: hypothetical protein E6212_09925 [Actinomyces sp.]|nr:hypothetical protein [Actinomyces sp.]
MAILLWVSTTTYGFTRILSLAFAYGVAFRIMRACLAAIIWQLIRFRRAKRAGSASGRRKRHAALALPVILLVPSAYIALVHGTPVVLDLVTGPRTVTVSSCTHKMHTHQIKWGDYWGRPKGSPSLRPHARFDSVPITIGYYTHSSAIASAKISN